MQKRHSCELGSWLLPAAARPRIRSIPGCHRRRLLALQEFKIQNMVGSCDVKFPIRLEGLASTHAMFCSVRRCSPLRRHLQAAGLGAHSVRPACCWPTSRAL